LPITVGGGGWIAMGVGRPTVAALAQTAVLYMVGTGRAALPELVRRLAYGLYLLILGIAIWPWKLPWQVDAQSGAQGTSDGLWTRREAAWFCAAYMSVPPAIAWTVSQIFKPMYSARYMLPFSVPFVILVAFGLDRLSKAWLRRAVLALLAVVMIWGLWAQVQIMEKPDWRGLAQRLSQEAQPGDLVLFMPGWHAKPFDYYSKGDLDLYYDVPIPVDRFGQEAIDNVAQAIEGHPRVWFVWEEDHYTDSAGQVHQYLDNECAEIDSWPMQWVGRVILYENVP